MTHLDGRALLRSAALPGPRSGSIRTVTKRSAKCERPLTGTLKFDRGNILWPSLSGARIIRRGSVFRVCVFRRNYGVGAVYLIGSVTMSWWVQGNRMWKKFTWP